MTTDFVLGELITHLFGLLPAEQATCFVAAVIAAAESGGHHLVHVSPQQFREAWSMRQQYSDKPDISFVDLTSFVVMRELGMQDVFTGDRHFRQVNLGFQLFPAVLN
ncbi:MAG: hypothetical protein WD066_11910 [Planctomycetaceae bacterium]